MIPNDFRRGQRREQPGEVAPWRPAADALERIRAEQAQAAAALARALAHGAGDVRGLVLWASDWLAEEVILCDDPTATITGRRRTPVTPS
jgi:hypothetical protein